MRTPTLVLVALSFCGGLLLHCDVGVPAWADEEPHGTNERDRAERVLKAECDLFFPEDPGDQEVVSLYARFEDPAIEVGTVIGARLCGWECGEGRTFEGGGCVSDRGTREALESAFAHPSDSCSSTDFEVGDGAVLVRCGNWLTSQSNVRHRTSAVLLLR